MTQMLVQAVAVGFFLSIQHQLLQLGYGEGMILSAFDELVLKKIAAVDIHNGLRSFHQRAFQQGKLFCIGCIGHDSVGKKGFVENGSSFCQRHGRIRQAGGEACHTAVMPGMAQLMGKGADIAERTGKIGQHTADIHMVDAGTECTAALAFPGEYIDPVLIKGIADEFPHFGREFAHFKNKLFPGFFDRIGPGLISGGGHGSKKIIEGKAVFMAQQFSLFAQVFAESGQRILHGRQHGIQHLAVHIAVEQGFVQDGGKMFCFTQCLRLAFDAVEAGGHGNIDFFVGFQFCFVGILTHLRICIVGESPGCRQGDGFAVYVYRQGGIQLITQGGEGVAASEGHFQDPFFRPFVHQMSCCFFIFSEGECDFLQLFTGGNDLFQVFDFAQEADIGRIEQGNLNGEAHQLVHQHLGFFVFCVTGQGKAGEIEQPGGQAADFFKGIGALFQRFLCISMQEGSRFFRQGFQGLKILLDIFVRKIPIENGKIPCPVHKQYIPFIDMNYLILFWATAARQVSLLSSR